MRQLLHGACLAALQVETPRPPGGTLSGDADTIAAAGADAAAADPLLATFSRRLVTIPGYFVLCLLAVATAPLWVPFAALVDARRAGTRAALRCLLFITWYLHCEVAGILASTAVWLASFPRTRARRERTLARNFALETWWARTLFEGGSRIFGFRLETHGEEALAESPFLLLMRHASIADTLLGAVLVQAPHGTRMRYVLKRELLWDPCLDLVGNRTPNYFVRRGSPDSAREISGVTRLARGLGPGDGLLIYPEGTRFTPDKSRQVLARLRAAGDAEILAFAESLKHVLPPRLGGTLALLDSGVDVVFGAHTGFEAAGGFWDLWAGSLVGRVIRAKFWRVRAADVPAQRDARVRWLFEQWTRIDAWVGAELAREAAAPAPRGARD